MYALLCLLCYRTTTILYILLRPISKIKLFFIPISKQYPIPIIAIISKKDLRHIKSISLSMFHSSGNER
ncbi:hypothetical protein CW304_07590 [Bacillus sp. UFRGS-B20]|nr:hypothetical protein CW304_07590 [Bacillus sp. UFRGS-B20]